MRAGYPESRAGLSTVRGWNRVGAEEDLFWPTPPHNLGMPLWPGDLSHHHHHHHHGLNIGSKDTLIGITNISGQDIKQNKNLNHINDKTNE